MKRLGVFLLPLDGMLVHRRLTLALNSPVPIYTPGWISENKVSWPKTQHNVPGQGSNIAEHSKGGAWTNMEITSFAPEKFFWGAKLVSLYTHTDLEFSFITRLELRSVEHNIAVIN